MSSSLSVTIQVPTAASTNPPEIEDKVIVSLQEERKRRLVTEFGYKDDYGLGTSTAKANQKRAAATQQADEWFFAQLGRQCAMGTKLVAARAFFHLCREDFGWKETYGKTTSTAQANKKREEANQKALKYVAEKFQYDVTMIQSWCF